MVLKFQKLSIDCGAEISEIKKKLKTQNFELLPASNNQIYCFSAFPSYIKQIMLKFDCGAEISKTVH